MSLANNIRYLRKSKGWSQDFVAEQLGYKSYTTIQKWEMGISEPPLKKLKELAQLFHVDMDILANSNLLLPSENNNSPDVDFVIETPDGPILIEIKTRDQLSGHRWAHYFQKFANLDDSHFSLVTNLIDEFSKNSMSEGMTEEEFLKKYPDDKNGEVG